MPRKRKNSEENDTGSPAWMTTYGDMMTLLLVFFVLLFSFSVLDLQKFRGFISSFQNQTGVLSGGKTISDEDLLARGSQGEKFNPAHANVSRIMGEMKKYIEKKGLDRKVKLDMTKRGLVVRLTGQVLYDLGKAKIKPGGKELLAKIASNITDTPNDIMVEGHTDNLPISNSKFPSNWELSTTRATNVIKYFIEEHDIDPTRLSAAGYSQYRPLYKNNTAEHRAANRRVEIVIKNSVTGSHTAENRGGIEDG